jgi:hypothetical protein
MSRQTFFGALRRPLPLVAASLYLLSITVVLARGKNPVGLAIFGSFLVLFTVTIVASYQTGTIQMYQGHGTSRQTAPLRYWFHLSTQTALWLAFNVAFGLVFWRGINQN